MFATIQEALQPVAFCIKRQEFLLELLDVHRVVALGPRDMAGHAGREDD